MVTYPIDGPPSSFHVHLTLPEAPFLTGPPAAFLSGRWRGDALRLAGREAHPSAEAERAQDLCDLQGEGARVIGSEEPRMGLASMG